MGLFDKIKKKNVETDKDIEEEDLYDNPIMTTSSFLAKDGSEIIEYNYIDIESAFKKTYDTIRLIVKNKPVIVEKNDTVYSALVSWYGQNDDIDREDNRKDDFSIIQLGIDFKKMQDDLEYRKAVMTELLDKSRVDMYISDGLKDKPFNKCGNYVGQVIVDKNTKRYKNGFNKKVGEISHNRPQQVKRREKYKKEIQEKNMKILGSRNETKKHEEHED